MFLCETFKHVYSFLNSLWDSRLLWVFKILSKYSKKKKKEIFECSLFKPFLRVVFAMATMRGEGTSLSGQKPGNFVCYKSGESSKFSINIAYFVYIYTPQALCHSWNLWDMVKQCEHCVEYIQTTALSLNNKTVCIRSGG